MSRSADEKTRTHNAYAFKRETRISGKWLDIGNARLEIDTARLPDHLRPLVPQLMPFIRGHVFLDRTPIGGFSGHVLVTPIGEQPPVPRPQVPQAEKEADALEEEF